jgi:truncated hemoglobin YjbI
LTKKKKREDEAKKKEADNQRQKQERLKQEREQESAHKAQREREAVNSTASQTRSDSPSILSDKEANEEADRESARMAKMFGGPAPKKGNEPHKTGVDALIQKERDHDQILRSHDQKVAEKAKAQEAADSSAASDWRKQEDEFQITNEANESEADREAARMAKMFGLSPGKLTQQSPKVANRSGPSSIGSTPLSEENSDDATAAKEAERMARMMGGSAKKYDPKEEERERERKKFEQTLTGIQDPKELSKAFLNDPAMLAHLKDVKGVIAVNTLKGVDVPGHKY